MDTHDQKTQQENVATTHRYSPEQREARNVPITADLREINGAA